MGRAVLVVTILATLSLVCAESSRAAPRGLGLGFHGGYGAAKDAESGSALLGAQVELRPASFLGLVGTISYQLDEEFEIQPGVGSAIAYDVHSIPISALARIYLPLQGFDPYVTAGAQWRYISYDFGHLDDALDNFTADDSETAFGWLVGAGMEFSTSHHVGFFGEARFEFIDADRDLGDADVENAEAFDYDQWVALGGVTFFLN
jgi:opacity protein-like surface antigen